MKNNISYLFVAVASFMAFSASAQNLDPTVEVSRDYEGKLLVVHKPILEMAVPDSVYRFDLDFDYSVTDTPYKGAYEFVPYSVDMTLEPQQRQKGGVYLKAGAGYRLHPTLDVVWSPDLKGPFRLDVYGRNRSYIGEYLPMTSSGINKDIVSIVEADTAKTAWKGLDLASSAGVSGRYDWTNAMFVFSADYLNLFQSQSEDIYALRARAFNSAGLSLGLASKDPHSVGLEYSVGLKYRFSDDLLNDEANGHAGVRAHDLDFGLNVESVLSGGHNLNIDAGFRMTDERKVFGVTAGSLYFAPSYVIKTTRLNFSAGVRFSTVFRTDAGSDMYSYKEQVIYPDFRAEYMVFPEFLKVYADVGGGCGMNTYSSLVSANRRLNMYYGRGVWNLLDVTEEKLSAELGFEGRITSRFGYTLRGGYRIFGNTPVQTLYVPEGRSDYLPGLGYTAYDLAFAALDFLLDTEPLRVDGSLRFNGVTGVQNDFDHIAGFVFPAPFTGDVSVMYDFKDRIHAGVDCEFATARDGYAYRKISGVHGKELMVTVPGYADLGVSLEYRFNKGMSFWVRGGNLLGMTIQRELLYAEEGPYVTAGICLDM